MFRRKTYTHLSDNELAEAYRKSGDKAIIAEIYKRFGHLMFGTCLNYLKNKEEAEDCVMSIFEALPEKLEKHSVEHVKSWLFMLTKNACLMELRKKNRVTQELQADLHQDEGGSDSKVVVEEKITALEYAITLLKDEQRRTIELFYLDRKSYIEISNLLELPLKKVKSAIQNGKRNLKLILEENDSFKSA